MVDIVDLFLCTGTVRATDLHQLTRCTIFHQIVMHRLQVVRIKHLKPQRLRLCVHVFFCTRVHTVHDTVLTYYGVLLPGITAYRDDVDNYNRYLELDWDEQQHKNIIKKVGFLCAYKNDSCQYYIDDASWLKCYDETKVTGSIAFYPPTDICYGSNNLQLDQGGITTYSFSGDTCTDDLNMQPNTMLTIRGYPKPTNTCMPDGNTNSQRGWFRMAVNATSAAQLRFDGVLGCKNSDCTNCECAQYACCTHGTALMCV